LIQATDRSPWRGRAATVAHQHGFPLYETLCVFYHAEHSFKQGIGTVRASMFLRIDKMHRRVCADGQFWTGVHQTVMKIYLIIFCLNRDHFAFLYSMVDEETGEHRNRNAEAKLRKLLQ
jgi:hypothetical protein